MQMKTVIENEFFSELITAACCGVLPGGFAKSIFLCQ